jgi:flagellar assembly protein FliH
MSSSPSRAPDASAVAELAGGKSLEVVAFPYSEAGSAPNQGSSPQGSRRPGGGSVDAASLAASLLEREAQLRELGRQQGMQECRAKFEEQTAAERGMLTKALTDFARERAAYYPKLEEEAVRLVLSIARRVLHREAQVDPLLLMGIVRVALERIEGATGVALVVPPQQADEWRKYLAMRMDPGDLPEIVEDAAMSPRQCALRTSMGTADLSLEAQLKEIEQGLMDLLAARPEGKS